jgi:hypothetical protein
MPQWGDEELFYLSLDRQLMAMPVAAAQTTVNVGTSKALFQMPTLIEEGRLLMPTSNNYLAAPDGRRFLAAVSARDPKAPPISVVVNWLAVPNQ